MIDRVIPWLFEAFLHIRPKIFSRYAILRLWNASSFLTILATYKSLHATAVHCYWLIAGYIDVGDGCWRPSLLYRFMTNLTYFFYCNTVNWLQGVTYGILRYFKEVYTFHLNTPNSLQWTLVVVFRWRQQIWLHNHFVIMRSE